MHEQLVVPVYIPIKRVCKLSCVFSLSAHPEAVKEISAVLYSHNGIPYSNESERFTVKSKYMDGS